MLHLDLFIPTRPGRRFPAIKPQKTTKTVQNDKIPNHPLSLPPYIFIHGRGAEREGWWAARPDGILFFFRTSSTSWTILLVKELG